MSRSSTDCRGWAPLCTCVAAFDAVRETVRLAASLGVFVLTMLVVAPSALAAQVPPDSIFVVDSARLDSVPRLIDPVLLRTRELRELMLAPAPISPGRAFLLSFAVPGLAQAKLDRSTSGALFAAVEMASFAMLRRSQSDVGEVRRQGTDTVPGSFTVNPSTGALTPGESVEPRFDEGLARTRRLHVEDWIAALAFNHLISAADAFVAAQLWDVPAQVGVVPTTSGWLLTASIRW